MAPYSWPRRRSTVRRLVPSVRVIVVIYSLVPRVDVAEVTSHPWHTDRQTHRFTPIQLYVLIQCRTGYGATQTGYRHGQCENFGYRISEDTMLLPMNKTEQPQKFSPPSGPPNAPPPAKALHWATFACCFYCRIVIIYLPSLYQYSVLPFERSRLSPPSPVKIGALLAIVGYPAQLQPAWRRCDRLLPRTVQRSCVRHRANWLWHSPAAWYRATCNVYILWLLLFIQEVMNIHKTHISTKVNACAK